MLILPRYGRLDKLSGEGIDCNCISLIMSTVFLLLCQLYFSYHVNYISHIMSTVFLSFACVDALGVDFAKVWTVGQIECRSNRLGTKAFSVNHGIKTLTLLLHGKAPANISRASK